MSDLTPTELAAVLQVKRGWVISHLAELPHYRVGNQIRFTPDDVNAIRGIGRNTPKPADPAGLTSRSRQSA
jgi:excisionase family DNA binding protein